jgi:hypothetical protein
LLLGVELEAIQVLIRLEALEAVALGAQKLFCCA